jgi:hypothetical protein
MTGSTVVPRVRGLTAIGGRRSSLPWPSGVREVRRTGGFGTIFEPAAALGSGFGEAPGKGVKESNGITLEAGLSRNKEPCTARSVPGVRSGACPDTNGSGESMRAAGRSSAASAPSV